MQHKNLTIKDIAFLEALSDNNDMDELNKIEHMSETELKVYETELYAYLESEKIDYPAFKQRIDRYIRDQTDADTTVSETQYQSNNKPFVVKKIEQIKQELRDFFTQGNAYCERIEPLAAADGNHKTASKTFSCLHGYISLNHENIFNEEKYKRLRFKCREELIDELFGRSIQVTIGPTTYDLGKVNRRGMAQTDIPCDVDFQQTIEVRLVAK